MPVYQPPVLLEASLRQLRSYVYRFYPELEKSNGIPLDFWSLEDDELFLEILSYMPLHISEEAQGQFEDWPTAFRLAFPIFWIEDDYEVNGWTALINAGEDMLDAAITAYRRIGMTEEADALAAALESIRHDPQNEDAAEQAFKSVRNPYTDEEKKFRTLVKFFRDNETLWFK
jgi:hypothetical protein